MDSDDLSIYDYEITLEHLKRHPVWGGFEDDDSEIVRPVTSVEPFLLDCDPLIIRADFTTPGDRALAGCVAVDRAFDRVYLVEVFVHDKLYGFNVCLPDIAKSQLEQLRRALANRNEPVFPLAFRTPVKGPDGSMFSGVFSPFR